MSRFHRGQERDSRVILAQAGMAIAQKRGNANVAGLGGDRFLEELFGAGALRRSASHQRQDGEDNQVIE